MIAIDSDTANLLMQMMADTQKMIREWNISEQKRRNGGDADRLLSERQTMEYLDRSSSGLHYYRQMGLCYYKKGKDIWYRKGDIDEWLASGYVNRHPQKALPKSGLKSKE